MQTSTPAIFFVWAEDRSPALDAELAAWFGRRRRLKAPAATRHGAFAAARPATSRSGR